MKIIVDTKTLDGISPDADVVPALFDPSFSVYPDIGYTQKDIDDFLLMRKKTGAAAAVVLDKLIEEQELTLVREALRHYRQLGVGIFIYGDFAVLNILKTDKNCVPIYDSKTLMTNYADAAFHKRLRGLVVPSPEITWEDMIDIINVGNSVLEAYGHHRIFYSKRPLLTAYRDYYDIHLNKNFYTIKESARSESYFISEGTFGTTFYTGFRLLIFKEIAQLKRRPQFLRINGAFIPADELAAVTDIYRRLLSYSGDVEGLYRDLCALYPNTKPGYFISGGGDE